MNVIKSNSPVLHSTFHKTKSVSQNIFMDKLPHTHEIQLQY